MRDEVLEVGRMGRSMIEKAEQYGDMKEEKEALQYDLEVLRNEQERLNT